MSSSAKTLPDLPHTRFPMSILNEQYLDNSVPSSRYNDGIAGVWREPYTGHPLGVSLILLVDKRQKQFEYECLG